LYISNINARTRTENNDTENYIVLSFNDLTEIIEETGFIQCILSVRSYDNYSCFTAFGI